MASDVERQHKLVSELESRRNDLDSKLNAARQRRAALDTDQQALLAKLAGGDEGARKQLRRIEGDAKESAEDLQAFSAAVSSNATALAAAQKALARAEDFASIDELEAQMKNFAVIDRDLQAALAVVTQKSSVLIAACKSVGQKLIARDERRWGHFGEHLAQTVRRSIFIRFETMGKDGAPRPTFSEAVATDLRRACAELRFAAQGRRMTPLRGESLYRVLTNIGGLRDIDAKPGDLIALPDDSETRRMLRDGSLQLIEGGEQHGAEAEVAA